MHSKHLFFDLDRTLWDFEKNSEVALSKLFVDLQLDTKIDLFENFFKEYKENNASLWKLYGKGQLKKEDLRDERFRVTLEKFEITDSQLVKKLSDGYVELSPQQTALFPDAIETLDELQLNGYNMHIITNGFKEVQHIKLKNSKLENYFDIIVCSEDVGKNKPSPDIFHYSMQKANATSCDSVMIGDDYEIDVLGALNVGMKAILFDPDNTHNHTEDEHRIHKLNELPDILPWVLRTIL